MVDDSEIEERKIVRNEREKKRFLFIIFCCIMLRYACNTCRRDISETCYNICMEYEFGLVLEYC